MKLSKEGAVRYLIRDAQANKITRASYRRVVTALQTLGLTEAEQKSILGELEYLRLDDTPRFQP